MIKRLNLKSIINYSLTLIVFISMFKFNTLSISSLIRDLIVYIKAVKLL